MQNVAETPSITSSCYTSSDYAGDALEWTESDQRQFRRAQNENVDFLKNAMRGQALGSLFVKPQEEIMANQNQRRIVQVFIADPNDNVPLDQSVLFKGDQKLTDLTDSELFFEVPIAESLKCHNEKRVKWLDKEASKRSGKDVFLEPARIRELKMVVVVVASF